MDEKWRVLEKNINRMGNFPQVGFDPKLIFADEKFVEIRPSLPNARIDLSGKYIVLYTIVEGYRQTCFIYSLQKVMYMKLFKTKSRYD